MEICIACPDCGHHRLKLTYEVSYEYSYFIDTDAPGIKNDTLFQPYLYDNRVQKTGEQYIECCSCQKRYPCLLQERKISAEQIQSILASARQ